jgi:hypothetical protein
MHRLSAVTIQTVDECYPVGSSVVNISRSTITALTTFQIIRDTASLGTGLVAANRLTRNLT